jgi:hypothetical protein
MINVQYSKEIQLMIASCNISSFVNSYRTFSTEHSDAELSKNNCNGPIISVFWKMPDG